MGSSSVINQWNEQWRSSPLYQQGLQAVGEPTNGPITLDTNQRKLLQQWLQGQGVQFPKGVEIDPAGNMNEDEGFGKQLKKWGPIVGGGALMAFGIPGLMPGLIGGAGAGGAGTAAASGTTFGGANAAGTIGGSLTSGLAGTNSALGTASGLFGAGAGTGIGTSMAGGGIGGFLGNIGKKLGGDLAQRFLGSAGAGLAGASQSAANNRGVALDAAMQEALIRQRQQEAYQDQLLGRAAEDRASLTDAFTKSVQADRVMNSTGYQPAALNLVPGGKPSTLPSFGTGFKAPSEQMKSSAQSLYSQVQPRLTQGSQLPALAPPTPYTNDPNLLKPSGGERIGSWLGPALSMAGAYRNPLTQRKDPNQGQQ